jgi:hypothetical protein
MIVGLVLGLISDLVIIYMMLALGHIQGKSYRVMEASTDSSKVIGSLKLPLRAQRKGCSPGNM